MQTATQDSEQGLETDTESHYWFYSTSFVKAKNVDKKNATYIINLKKIGSIAMLVPGCTTK